MYDLDDVEKDKEDEAIDALPDFMKPDDGQAGRRTSRSTDKSGDEE